MTKKLKSFVQLTIGLLYGVSGAYVKNFFYLPLTDGGTKQVDNVCLASLIYACTVGTCLSQVLPSPILALFDWTGKACQGQTLAYPRRQ